MNNRMKFAASPKVERAIEITVHVLTWSYVFLSPLFFKHSNESVDWGHYLRGSFFPLATCIAFYINYFVLIPECLLRPGRVKWFFAANVLVFVLGQFVVEFVLFPVIDQSLPLSAPKPVGSSPGAQMPKPQFPPKILFVVRGFLTFVFAVGISVALRLSLRWRKSEQARAEAEAKRTEAELKNLKNQINPHFLLNTLNNIYALTAFDQEKAQQAILELSRMLRYMLYENQTDRVSLSKEVDFLQSYVSLMRLRIYDNVDVQVKVDAPLEEELPVAPLIFISLVENAFKHGISPTEPSYIHITLQATRYRLRFCCENSNFPKSKTSDKAPGGIGLSQVSRRLELSYPGRYTWKAGPSADGRAYTSEIIVTA